MDDVLVLVRDCETWQPHVRYAADLAAKLHGSLNGIYVSPSAIPVPADASAAFAQEIVEIYREEASRALRADVPFARWTERQGIPHSSWHVAKGSPVEVLEAVANWHDLMVLKAYPEPFGDTILETGAALVRVGLPCIIVPPATDKARLDTIAIAWNGSPQAARAVHDALPLLRQASRIVIIRAKRPDVAWGEERINAVRFLEQHQLRCEHLDLDADEHEAGAAILAGAARLSADLLVLGAYGRVRFSEWMFGGVTRHVLQHTALPLFMRH